MNLVVVTDGASHRNGKTCGVGIVFYDGDRGVKLTERAEVLGEGTNTFAEYQAAILGARMAHEFVGSIKTPITSITLLTDSSLVVSQANGEFKARTGDIREMRDTLLAAVEDLKELIKSDEVKIDHAPREYTHEADNLARSVVEDQVSQEFENKYPFLKQ